MTPSPDTVRSIDDRLLKRALQVLGKFPDEPDGFRMSRRGAIRAIKDLIQAYIVEDYENENSIYSSTLSKKLLEISIDLNDIAEKLSGLDYYAKARISMVPSEYFWSSDFEKFKISIQSNKDPSAAIGLANSLGIPLNDIDQDFIYAKAMELLKNWKSNNGKNPSIIVELLALSRVMKQASELDRGALVDGGNAKSYRESHMHPKVLLIRESDAILLACSGGEILQGNKNNRQTRSKHQTHEKLKQFVEIIFEAITGKVEADTEVDQSMRSYRNSYIESNDVHPFAWLIFRTATLLREDLLQSSESNKYKNKERLCELNDIIERYSNLQDKLFENGSESINNTKFSLIKRHKGKTYLS